MKPSALAYLDPTAMRVNGETMGGDLKAAWSAILESADRLVAFDAASSPYTHAAWFLDHEGRDVTVFLRLEDK